MGKAKLMNGGAEALRVQASYVLGHSLADRGETDFSYSEKRSFINE
jgi:hypothetical protein